MASGRGLSEIVLAQLGALNFFVWAVAGSMSSTQLRTYTGIECILYMYNLGTAPNVQNLPEIAVCTPEAIAIDHCICYIDYNSTHRTQPGHWPRFLRYNLKGRSRMVSRLDCDACDAGDGH